MNNRLVVAESTNRGIIKNKHNNPMNILIVDQTLDVVYDGSMCISISIKVFNWRC